MYRAGGVWVFAPSGRLIGKVAIPELPANLHWAGADWRTLDVCALTSVYAVDVKVGPRPEPFMRRTKVSGAPAFAGATGADALRLDPARCAPIIQDMQNDVVMDGGAEPAPVAEVQDGDFLVEKNRMSAWEGTQLETILKATGRDRIIETGAWTNMSIEHTARTGADKGYVMVIPEDGCSTMNADWHRASILYAMQNVALVTTTDAVLAALR